jgi:16S rRNA (guanine966-N2)-methyltransferase
MSLRITGGSLRGRALTGRVPEGVRPTGSLVRQALFDILGHEIVGASFLDATGGTGLVAIEAWSRGAAPVLAVEKDRRAAASLRASLLRLGLDGRIALLEADALQALPRRGGPGFDLIFADPPYHVPLGPWVEALRPIALGRLILQHASRVEAPPAPAGSVLASRRYGDTTLSFYEIGTP